VITPALVALALGGCWTGTAAPPLANTAGAEPPPPPRSPRVRGRPVPRLRTPPSLTPAQRRFPPDLRAMRADAYACAQTHGVSLTQTLSFEVTVDSTGAVTAAKVTGFGAAEPCVLAAIRARTFIQTTGTTVTLTIPWSSAHPWP
jgi:hypothetical protein